jgi:hypothetical protein
MTFRRLLVCVALEDELDAQMESPDTPVQKLKREQSVQQFTVSKDTGSLQGENVSFFLFFSLFLGISFFFLRNLNPNSKISRLYLH